MNNTALKSLLRLNDEPYIYINEIDSHNILMQHCHEFMESLLDFYMQWNIHEADIQLPLKQVFTDSTTSGDFRVMPCLIEHKGLKFVKVIGTNEEETKIKDKISVGKALLIDYYDNFVYALLDVCALSSFRTAAISVLAMRLTGYTPENTALVGSGRIGFYTAYILHNWMGISSFRVTDTNKQNYENFVNLSKHYLPDVSVTYMPLESLLSTSDAVFLSTTSTSSLLNRLNSSHISFVSSVGADADNLSEIDASLLQTHRLLTDSTQSMGLGDMKKWSDAGLLKSKPTELKDFIHEKCNNYTKNHFLFISTGIAIQDAIISKFIYNKIHDA